MIRSIRLYAYFLLGVMLAFAAMAPAYAQSVVHYAASNFMVVSSPGGLARSISFAPSVAGPAASGWGPPTIGNVGGGAAALNYSGNVAVGAGAGARVAVSVPVAVASRLSPMAIAKAAVRLTPTGVMVGVLAPVLLEAGIQYANGQYSRGGTAGGTTQAATLSTSPATEHYYSVLGYNGTNGNAACVSIAAAGGFGSSGDFSNMSWMSDDAGSPYRTHCKGKYQTETTVREMGTFVYKKWCPNDGNIRGMTETLNCSSYVCPAGQNWTLSGSSCTRPACSSGEVRDSGGVCVSSVMSEDEAAAAMATALQTSGDPAAIVSAFPPGTQVDPDPPVVTGPASVTSPAVTTTNTTNNVTTTVTNSTTVNNTYNNNQITTTVTNNTVTKNAAGEVVASQAEQGTPDPSKEDTPPVLDTPMSEIPTLYERKYPDGIKGVWDTRSAEMKATPLFGLTAVFAPSVGGGSCPAWSMSANIGPKMMFGTHSLSPPCWIWTALKAVVIVTALLLARSLIFGG